MTRQSASAKKAPSAFRTISEVADELEVQQHVLRFWETKFTQIKPLKRGGGRRYYRPEDISLLKHIHDLLYKQGYTIKGVQKLLKGQTRNQIAANVNDDADMVGVEAAAEQSPVSLKVSNVTAMPAQAQLQAQGKEKAALKAMLADLKELRSLIGDVAQAAG